MCTCYIYLYVYIYIYDKMSVFYQVSDITRVASCSIVFESIKHGRMYLLWYRSMTFILNVWAIGAQGKPNMMSDQGHEMSNIALQCRRTLLLVDYTCIHTHNTSTPCPSFPCRRPSWTTIPSCPRSLPLVVDYCGCVFITQNPLTKTHKTQNADRKAENVPQQP